MPNPTTAWHRTQQIGPTGSWQRKFGCCFFSHLGACADATSGAYGPQDATGDIFRSLQRDKEGGIDLYDGKVAARRMDPFLDFTVFANYGPSQIDYPGMKRDHPPMLFTSLVAYVRAGRPVVVSGDYDVIPGAPNGPSCQATYDGLHAIMIPAFGYRIAANGREELLWSDPLCKLMKWVPANLVKAYAGKQAGANLANASIGPRRSRLVVHGRIGPYWAYLRRVAGGFSRHLRVTKGFTVPCEPPFAALYGRTAMSLVKVVDTPGGNWPGTHLNVRESPITTLWRPV